MNLKLFQNLHTNMEGFVEPVTYIPTEVDTNTDKF